MALKRFGAVSLVCLVASLVLAASAFATEGAAKWSSANATWAGTLTFKRAGGNASTCTFGNVYTSNSGSTFGYFGEWKTKCSTGATTGWFPEGEAYYEESQYFLQWRDNPLIGFHASPWTNRALGSEGEYVTIPFTNGSGSTFSKVKFSENVVGVTDFGETVTVSGELTVSWGGKAVTLSPA